MTMIKKIGLLTLVTVALTSCSMLSPVKTEPKTAYVINALPRVSTHARHATTIMVSQVGSEAIYNTSQMAYSKHPYQVAYFAKNRWAARPADMLQPLIIQTLQNTHYFHAVVTSSSIGQADYLLNTQLIQMQQEFNSCSSYYRMKLRAQLINVNTNKTIATKVFSVTINAPYYNPYGGVIAANQATAIILKKLTKFCLNRL